jgi:predicted pyridoxine 5'-phosphate oxidase superfamily flavin-nucleotide-binding protein
MSDDGMYSPGQRAFQDRFESRRLADRIEEAIVADRLSDADRAFIAARDMFFLATVDARGRPACSYKGGAPGFVRALDDRTLAFPLYDGNGMWVSAGNVLDTRWVSLLFIAFDEPERLRVTGTASFDPDDELLGDYHEAQAVARVRVQEKYVQCPRYVHRMERVERSPHVPRAEATTPLAAWKMLDIAADVLPERDVEEIARRRRGGLPLPEAAGASRSDESSLVTEDTTEVTE